MYSLWKKGKKTIFLIINSLIKSFISHKSSTVED